MTNNQIIAVIQHHEKGGQVQVSNKGQDHWIQAHNPVWDFHLSDYRIKPEEKKKLWFWRYTNENNGLQIYSYMLDEESAKDILKNPVKLESLGYACED